MSASPDRLTHPKTRQTYGSILAEDHHDNVEAYLHAADHYCSGIELADKRVLEVGSGKGLFALYMALRGAHVLSMEPELWGSTPGASSLQETRAQRLGVTLDYAAEDFNTWSPGGRVFDVVVLASCINHLHESRESALHHQPTFDAYQAIAAKLLGILAPGGVVVASDANRHAFFTMVKEYGIRRPWATRMTSVNWRVHQDANVWARIFTAAGFARVHVDYPVPYRLRSWAPLVNTSLANFFLEGKFILKAWGRANTG